MGRGVAWLHPGRCLRSTAHRNTERVLSLCAAAAAAARIGARGRGAGAAEPLAPGSVQLRMGARRGAHVMRCAGAGADTASGGTDERRAGITLKQTEEDGNSISCRSRRPQGADGPFATAAGRGRRSNLAVSVRVHLELPLVAANLKDIAARTQTQQNTYCFQYVLKSPCTNQLC
jgi:hypothetical protein